MGGSRVLDNDMSGVGNGKVNNDMFSQRSFSLDAAEKAQQQHFALSPRPVDGVPLPGARFQTSQKPKKESRRFMEPFQLNIRSETSDWQFERTDGELSSSA
ncbi:hypothetical protein NDU88_009609 [Pleurodeles waltl]|uniref:Uncharacterized protein n=1 Tax=Pleurodeles waltl TaxID=8319 RepID=A0AAV7RYV8_PLEWA|nr:hypothetical protein NDU88_009609 [Pleurodeles waltl]